MATRKAGPTLIQRSRAVSPAEKAAFHQVVGAGRSRVVRPFFEINASEEDEIVEHLGVLLDQQLEQH